MYLRRTNPCTLSVRPRPAGRCGSSDASQLDYSDATRDNDPLKEGRAEKWSGSETAEGAGDGSFRFLAVVDVHQVVFFGDLWSVWSASRQANQAHLTRLGLRAHVCGDIYT